MTQRRSIIGGAATGWVLALVCGAGAWADPTPAPGPTTPAAPAPSATAAPSPSPNPDPRSTCIGIGGTTDPSSNPNPQGIRWCFDWITYDTRSPGTPRTRWQTVCSKATTVEEQVACDAASLTLASPPPEATTSVLSDLRPDTGTPLVRCDWFTEQANADSANADRWRAKHDRCQQLEGYYLAQVYVPADTGDGSQPTEDCGVADVACQVRQGLTSALAAGIRDGIQGLVDLVVQAFAWLLSKLAEMIFSNLSLGDPSDAFYDVYNQVAATLLILVTVFVIVSTIINGLRLGGPGPLSTLGGLVRAILGIIFAGGIAWTITKAWDEATVALIDHFAAQPWDASSWVNGVSALSSGAGTMFLALLVALFGLIGEILLIIMLLFRSLLAWGAALFGAMAMTGQVMAETRGWGRRWFWTVNALASSKFFIAAIWIYGSRAAYGSDSLITSLQALLMIWLMVAAPGVLLRLTTLWDGYLADVNAGSVLAAAGRGLDAINPLGGGGSGEAPETMQTASSGIPTIPDGAHVDGWTDPLGLGDDVATSADGEPVGDPSRVADRGQQEAGDLDQPQGQQPGRDDVGRPNADDAGRPNADEAEATQAGTDAAHTDLTTGQLTAPTAPQTSHSTPDHDDDERSHDDDQRPPASASGARPASGATGDAAVAGEVPPIV